MTRRSFNGDSVDESLSDQRGKTIAAAKEIGVAYLDLNKASTDYVNAIGEDNAAKYDLSDGDKTHLNTAGEIVFGRMVADLLLQERDDLEGYFEPNKALSDKIWGGEFASGDE